MSCPRPGPAAHLETSKRRATEDLARHRHGSSSWTFYLRSPSLEKGLGGILDLLSSVSVAGEETGWSSLDPLPPIVTQTVRDIIEAG
ncbi:unnamed protein product [Dibothriocephalus latus]|uniref:Uncharacterized protein n=1 Tax=Dibothriocephalus latus TaxID=60516 RepID=A0A3P7LSR1_DIBLA|nr:unnamed protein product [Dibothriocephalus latus]